VSLAPIEAALAAALVQGGFNFQTNVSKMHDGTRGRLFQLLFELPNELGQYIITSHVGELPSGAIVIMAVAPLRITSTDVVATRHAIADFIIPKVPFVRVMQDLTNLESAQKGAWLESAIPVSMREMPWDETVIVAPVQAITVAMELVRTMFRDATSLERLSIPPAPPAPQVTPPPDRL
jgi:hypothetical protein